MEENIKIAELIALKIKNQISKEQDSILQDWLMQDPSNEEIYKKFLNDNFLLEKYDDYQKYDASKNWDNLNGKLPKQKEFSLYSGKALRFAASIILPLFLASWLIYYFAVDTDPLADIDEVIKPVKQMAELKLSNGTTIDLGETETVNPITETGGVKVFNYKTNLTYQEADSITKTSPLVFNELITPKGGKYQLTLADGTNVWLNAASTLRYPVTFNDSTREVYLTGEAFFDVTHSDKPFIVNAEKIDVRVLGTTFNINSYEDESIQSTTLVEGRVQISSNLIAKILYPNQRASFNQANDELTVENVNTSIYTSWVDGKIEFKNEDLESVMRRLSRYYNFEFVFQNELAKSYHFTARIENQKSISSILEMLEMTTSVKFKLEETTIVIL